MTQWVAFASVTGVVLAALILLAHASQQLITETVESDRSDGHDDGDRDGDADRDADAEPPADEPHSRPRQSLSTAALLVNVAFTQGLFGAIIVAGAWYARVPPAALGLDRASVRLALLGLGLGVALYVADEALAAAADGVGIEYSEELRAALSPESARGWAVLLLVVLPVIAGFEELLFRAALIGALGTGFGVSPWLLAVVSTVLFAVGHGAQGTAGILVTGVLGFALAAAFVLTGSLLTVVVAHYLVNALEFVVHEGLGVDPR